MPLSLYEKSKSFSTRIGLFKKQGKQNHKPHTHNQIMRTVLDESRNRSSKNSIIATLKKQGYNTVAISRAIERFNNDLAFLDIWVKRQERLGKSPEKIRAELQRKGWSNKMLDYRESR